MKSNIRGENVRIRIYNYIVDYLEEHGYPPSIREIADGVDLKSASAVHNHLCTMFEQGILETDAKTGTPRAIRVPGYRFTKGGNHGWDERGDRKIWKVSAP